jgi:hypothetical protein
MHQETANAAAIADATVVRGATNHEQAEAHGVYTVECIGPDGEVKWRDTIENVVCTEGKNVALDAALAGSAYTVVGPYMGLISSTSYTATRLTRRRGSRSSPTSITRRQSRTSRRSATTSVVSRILRRGSSTSAAASMRSMPMCSVGTSSVERATSFPSE